MRFCTSYRGDRSTVSIKIGNFLEEKGYKPELVDASYTRHRIELRSCENGWDQLTLVFNPEIEPDNRCQDIAQLNPYGGIEVFHCILLAIMNPEIDGLTDHHVTNVTAYSELPAYDYLITELKQTLDKTFHRVDLSEVSPLVTAAHDDATVVNKIKRSDASKIVEESDNKKPKGGRPRVKDRDRADYLYRLCIAQRAVELLEQKMQWKEINHKLHWTRHTDLSQKTLERTLKLLKTASKADLDEIKRLRGQWDDTCRCPDKKR